MSRQPQSTAQKIRKQRRRNDLRMIRDFRTPSVPALPRS